MTAQETRLSKGRKAINSSYTKYKSVQIRKNRGEGKTIERIEANG